ncbi:hypothetical protein P4E94_08425 [Pontiellaceae bacterium B12219]|nr:hypothetical protein [Pontiellaceae bacterium B12219]
MKSNVMNLFIAGMAVVLLSGCASSNNPTWANPKFKDHSLGKTMVWATFEDDILSGEYEVLFTECLLDYVPAASMHNDVKDLKTMNKKSVDALLKANSVQTLIVTHVVSSENEAQLVPYGVSYQTYGNQDASYYLYCSAFQLDNAVVNFTENSIETTLFDVKSGALIWSGLKEVYTFNSNTSNMKKVINDIIRELEKDGML